MNKFLSKSEIKEIVIDTLKHFQETTNSKIQFPVPIKAIAKSYSNIRVIPFSKQMEMQNLTYMEMTKQCKTEDAYTDYKNNMYIIYYNDVLSSKVSSKRYRWNIAHELGHIQLCHHIKFEQTKLFRNELSAGEYKTLEREADWFASYILAPYLPLYFIGANSKEDIERICKISSDASGHRFDDYIKWKNNPSNTDPKNSYYEYALWQMFFGVVRCDNCKSIYFGEENYVFCKVCGKKTLFFSWRENKMIYSKIEQDTDNKPIRCPKCQNEQLPSEGEFCQICGICIYNDCLGDQNGYGNPCEHGMHLSGEARYCPYCGSETTYLQSRLLKPYNEELNAADEDDDYPF